MVHDCPSGISNDLYCENGEEGKRRYQKSSAALKYMLPAKKEQSIASRTYASD